jgi:hypothetical protein
VAVQWRPLHLLAVHGGGLVPEGCEEAVGCWVPPAATGTVNADVADGLRSDRQVTDSRVVRQAKPGDEGDADTGADEGAHEAVVTGAAGDAGPEAAGGGEGVQDGAGVAPALYPAVIGEFGQGGYVLAGQGGLAGTSNRMWSSTSGI